MRGYNKQRPIGGLVAYYLDLPTIRKGRFKLFLQVYGTTSFTRKITAAEDTRVWSRLTFPLESLRLLRNSGRSVLS